MVRDGLLVADLVGLGVLRGTPGRPHGVAAQGDRRGDHRRGVEAAADVAADRVAGPQPAAHRLVEGRRAPASTSRRAPGPRRLERRPPPAAHLDSARSLSHQRVAGREPAHAAPQRAVGGRHAGEVPGEVLLVHGRPPGQAGQHRGHGGRDHRAVWSPRRSRAAGPRVRPERRTGSAARRPRRRTRSHRRGGRAVRRPTARTPPGSGRRRCPGVVGAGRGAARAARRRCRSGRPRSARGLARGGAAAAARAPPRGWSTARRAAGCTGPTVAAPDAVPAAPGDRLGHRSGPRCRRPRVGVQQDGEAAHPSAGDDERGRAGAARRRAPGGRPRARPARRRTPRGWSRRRSPGSGAPRAARRRALRRRRARRTARCPGPGCTVSAPALRRSTPSAARRHRCAVDVRRGL